MSNFKSNRSQKGFSLVELMVGMTISLFVAGVALSYLITSSRNLTEKTGLDLIQENSRFALEILSTSIRQAGLNNVRRPNTVNLNNPTQGTSNTIDPVFTDSICTSNLNLQPTIPGASSVACNQDNVNNTFGAITTMQSDRLAIQLQTERSFLTCAGTTITPSQDEMVRAVTIFWAGDIDGDGVSSLYCQTYIYNGPVLDDITTYTLSGTAVPLVDGVEMLQVQYGVDTIDAGSTEPDGDVDKYVSFSNVAASETDDIVSIKIGLLVSPGQAIATEQNSDNISEEKEYRVLDGYYKSTAGDRVRRQAVSTTVFLPNMAS